MAKDLKILMIGNSFSICLGKNLPQIVKSVPGNRLKLTSAYIGGCTLIQHWENLLAAEKDPDFKPYQIDTWYSYRRKEAKRFGNLKELLPSDQWDIITIQQGSHHSWDYSNYQPWADHLISFIRQHAPQAEIVIQQTWAYRIDNLRLKEWGITQEEMHSRLEAAYRKLSGEYALRQIPTGLAVKIFREKTPVKFRVSPEKSYQESCWPDFPPQAGEVVGSCLWKKSPESGEMVLCSVRFHLNIRGEYMQACLFFTVLFEEPVEKIRYINPEIGTSDAQFLQKCAQEAADLI